MLILESPTPIRCAPEIITNHLMLAGVPTDRDRVDQALGEASSQDAVDQEADEGQDWNKPKLHFRCGAGCQPAADCQSALVDY